MQTSTVRPYAESDFAQLVELLRQRAPIPGQPRVSSEMVQAALNGTSPIDGGWWAELTNLRHLVVPDNGNLAGAVAVGTSKADGAGYLLWLAADDNEVVETLVDAAVSALEGTSVQRAFSFATALDEGLEGLPVRLRPVVHQALLSRGFAGEDMWVYMRRDLTATDSMLADDDLVAAFTVSDGEDPQSWRITADGGADEGVVVIGLLPSGTGIVEWLHVDDAHRGRGLGKAVLSVGLRHLVSLGATEAILYVDHDAPETERDRAAALALYEAAGFEVVDHLHSYERPGS
ncbi:GNAT family N-acetyltransferase [Nocardioides sp.]|uniref:GNAT family N-acetyltransferase n=1 Tax=Nocardioides sp. TaxID=35761 RepID=UPI0025F49B4E|nr:GNAT family N-acetyltransferase [Nocardioides sp.]